MPCEYKDVFAIVQNEVVILHQTVNFTLATGQLDLPIGLRKVVYWKHLRVNLWDILSF
jgi:hypothetical protein